MEFSMMIVAYIILYYIKLCVYVYVSIDGRNFCCMWKVVYRFRNPKLELVIGVMVWGVLIEHCSSKKAPS